MYVICTDDADNLDISRKITVLTAHKSKQKAQERIAELYQELEKEYGEDYETSYWVEWVNLV